MSETPDQDPMRELTAAVRELIAELRWARDRRAEAREKFAPPQPTAAAARPDSDPDLKADAMKALTEQILHVVPPALRDQADSWLSDLLALYGGDEYEPADEAVIARDALAASGTEPAPVAPVGIPDLIRYWRDEAVAVLSDERPGGDWASQYLIMCAEMAEAVLAGKPGAYSCTECGWISQPEYWHWTDDHDKVAAPPDESEADIADYTITPES